MATKNQQQVNTILITALAKGATVPQAAHQAGVSERTVFRRRQQPEFEARIATLQDETIQRAAAILTAAAQEGIRSLVALQKDSTPPTVRRAAARDIIEVGLRLREAVELDKRLGILETLAAGASVPSDLAGAVAPVPRAKRRRRGDAIVQAALASGDSVAQAASKAGLSERTIYRRQQDPAFQRSIEALRAAMVQRAAALLIAAILLATKTLTDLQDPSTPASVRRRASRDIIELGQKLRQITIVEKRLVALENQHIPLQV